MSLYRIVDANINRVSEGLRVLEDLYRFYYEDLNMSSNLRQIRHGVRKTYSSIRLYESRDSLGDIGLEISRGSSLDQKSDLEDLILSNFKRVQEGLRSIEEALKVLGHNSKSKEYELFRFRIYDLERRAWTRKDVLGTDIYAILGEEFSNGKNNIEMVEELGLAGVKIVQYREKNKTKEEKWSQCLRIRDITKKYGMTFIVNDDLDIALGTGADGIHIGQDDVPIEIIRRAAPKLIVGLSTHNEKQALEAFEKGADYIGVGPIFETKTKKDIEKSEGLEFLKWVSKNIEGPYVAIGGIKESNVCEVRKAGAYCVAMISELVGSKNIGNKVKSIRKKLEEEY